MMYTINRGNVEEYQDGQEPLIYLATTVETIQQAKLTYVFTDGHGIMQITGFYNDPEDLMRIDWPLMKSKYWGDTVEDPDRSRRRQAEFLIHKFVPWNVISFIGTYSKRMTDYVRDLMKDTAGTPRVETRRQWYY